MVQAAINAKKNNLIETTKNSFTNYGDIFIVNSIEEVNNIAPEHAELLVNDYEKYEDKITNAGALFVGPYSTEPVCDYF